MNSSDLRLFLVHMMMKLELSQRPVFVCAISTANLYLEPHTRKVMFSDWLLWPGRTSASDGMSSSQTLAPSLRICASTLTFLMLHLHVKAIR